MSELFFLVIGIFISLLIFFYFVPIGLYFTALLSGIEIRLVDLIMMKFRKTDPTEIIRNKIMLQKTSIDVSIHQLEAHKMAGGNLANVTSAMIKAKIHNIDLEFKKASAADLEGYDVLEEVKKEIEKRKNNH